jgi:hypothetical protein
MTPKERRALEIRDAAARRYVGASAEGQLVGPCLVYPLIEGDITIVRNELVEPGGRRLPHGIDIWHLGKKVFNIEWDDAEEFHLRAFRRGPWEEKIIAADPG